MPIADRGAAPARRHRVPVGILPALLLAQPAVAASTARVHASYFYSYMNADHLDSLARAGFDRAVIKCIQDSLGSRGATEYRGFFARAPQLGVEVVPEWSLQATDRLAALPTQRRYTWNGTVEPNVGCPADSIFWRSALRDRAAELLDAFPSLHHLALDLEIYTGSCHHYDQGPCRCACCLTEFATRPPGAANDLAAFQERRVASLLEGLLRELGAMRPGLALDVFDLDLDSFVHRAMARALARTATPTANYSERSYASGAAAIPAARAALDSLGLAAPLIGGLQLGNFPPESLGDTADAVLQAAEGYFIFTSYSLWQAPQNLAGPYRLLGTQAAYWDALRGVNGAAAGVAAPAHGAAAPGLRLLAPWPNPSGAGCRIRFELDAPADVTLMLLDVQGREIRRFGLGARRAAAHAVVWDGRDAAGAVVEPGVYFLRARAGAETRTARILRTR